MEQPWPEPACEAAMEPAREAAVIPEGFTHDPSSGLYYLATPGQDPSNGAEGTWYTWFYPDTGEYKRVFYPSGPVPQIGGAPNPGARSQRDPDAQPDRAATPDGAKRKGGALLVALPLVVLLCGGAFLFARAGGFAMFEDPAPSKISEGTVTATADGADTPGLASADGELSERGEEDGANSSAGGKDVSDAEADGTTYGGDASGEEADGPTGAEDVYGEDAGRENGGEDASGVFASESPVPSPPPSPWRTVNPTPPQLPSARPAGELPTASPDYNDGLASLDLILEVLNRQVSKDELISMYGLKPCDEDELQYLLKFGYPIESAYYANSDITFCGIGNARLLVFFLEQDTDMRYCIMEFPLDALSPAEIGEVNRMQRILLTDMYGKPRTPLKYVPYTNLPHTILSYINANDLSDVDVVDIFDFESDFGLSSFWDIDGADIFRRMLQNVYDKSTLRFEVRNFLPEDLTSSEAESEPTEALATEPAPRAESAGSEPMGEVIYRGLTVPIDLPPYEGIMELRDFRAVPDGAGGYDCSFTMVNVSYGMTSSVYCQVQGYEAVELVLAEEMYFDKGGSYEFTFEIPAIMLSEGDCDVWVEYTFW